MGDRMSQGPYAAAPMLVEPPVFSTSRKISVDGTSGAVYVWLRDGPVARTVRMPTEGMGLILNVDVDESGTVLGVEII